MTTMPMLTIVPSRGRPNQISALLKIMENTRDTVTDVIIAVDSDDEHLDDYTRILEASPAWARLQIGKRIRMLPTLNKVAMDNVDDYQVIGFMGDDHRPLTFGWDVLISRAMKLHPGVVYCNDLLQGANLATAAFLDTNIIRALGFMAPPNLIHLYADNFWMDLGRATNLSYLGNVIIEHMHPTAGKSKWDPGYIEVNSEEMYDADRNAYEYFKKHCWADAMTRVRDYHI